MKFCRNCQAKLGFLEGEGPNSDLCSKCNEIKMQGMNEHEEDATGHTEGSNLGSEEPFDYSGFDADSILLTTESNPNLSIENRIEIISAECVFGMNLIKDMLAGITDIIGGRSNQVENTLGDARKHSLYVLKREAYRVGANAVVAVDLDYSEISGGGKSMMFIVASGTAVKIPK